MYEIIDWKQGFVIKALQCVTKVTKLQVDQSVYRAPHYVTKVTQSM